MRPSLRLLLLFLLAAPLAHAGRPVDSPSYDLYLDKVLYDEAFFPVSNLWGVIAAGLVFFMHLGFATLEAGFAREKHVVNVLYKNIYVVCLGLIAYAAFGFTTMFPGEFGGWLGFHGWFGVPTKDYFDLMTPRYDQFGWWTDFLFQAMIAAKAAARSSSSRFASAAALSSPWARSRLLLASASSETTVRQRRWLEVMRRRDRGAAW